MDRANNSYRHQFEKTAHSPHYLGLYHYHAPARGHKYTWPRIRMQNHINSNGIDMVINMLITPSLCLCVCCGKQIISTRKERWKQLCHPVIRWHKQQCQSTSRNTHTFISRIHYTNSTQKDPTSNGSIRKQQSPPLHTSTQPMWVRWGPVIVLYEDIETNVFDNLSTLFIIQCVYLYMWVPERERER